MADNQNMPAPPPGYSAEDVVSASASPSSAQAPPPPPGYSADQIVAAEPQTAPAEAQSQPSDTSSDKPGFWSRAYETSGAKGVVDLVAQHETKEQAQARLKQPMELYNEAIEAFDKGDFKNAAASANKLIAYTANGFMSKDNPLYKAAEAIILHPIEQIGETLKSAAAGNGLQAAQHAVHAVPFISPITDQIADNVNEDAHSDNWKAVAGDVLGPLMTLGLGKVAGAVGEAGGELGEAGMRGVAPSEVKIAGEKVPVASNHPNLPSQGIKSNLISKVASQEGAANFVKQQVQPAAVRAARGTFSRAALDSVDELRTLRGEPSVHKLAPSLSNVSDMADFMREQVKPTYEKLDQAGQTAQDAWEQTYGKAARAAKVQENTPTLYDADNKPLPKPPQPNVPPKPKNFSELKTAIKDAEDTLEPGGGTNVEQTKAREALPALKKELQGFLKTHESVVSPEELETADKVWAKSRAYDWLDKKVRSATQGRQPGNIFGGQEKSLRPSSLKNIPKTFENKYGEGAWQRLLGPEGVKNYNDVIAALEMPKVGGGNVLQWLGKLRWEGTPLLDVAKFPFSHVADKLLFDPEFGQKALGLWKTATQNSIPKVGQAAGVTGMELNAAQRRKNVYSGASSALGGP